MSIDSPAAQEIASAVAEKLRRAGLMTGGSGGFRIADGANALASAIAARLAQGVTPHPARGRTVSEGMMRLASAVSYKLGKADDPRTASFNKVASEVAGALYQARKSVVEASGEGGEQVAVHSSLKADRSGASD